MSVTVKSLIDQALRKLGVIDTGAQPDESEYADALAALRQMIDAWSLEDLMIPYQPTESFAVSSDKAFYSMGVGGDWDTARPEMIEVIRIQHGGTTYPVKRSSREAFAEIGTLSVRRPSRFITTADAFFHFIEFDAYPDSGTALVTSLKPFNVEALENFDNDYDPDADPQPLYPSGFTMVGIQTPITFPTGYEKAIVYNLALELVPEYPGFDVSAVVAQNAMMMKGLIKRRNWRPGEVRIDPVLRGVRRLGTYDVNSGPGW